VLEIRGGVLQGRTMSAAEVESLATLPPTDVLRGQVLAAIIGPLSALHGLVSAPLQNLHGLIDARIEQLGGAEAAPAAEEPALEEETPAAAPEEPTAEGDEAESPEPAPEGPTAAGDEPTQADATASAAETDLTETEEA
jgi:large subunit ribosomal protein L10